MEKRMIPLVAAIAIGPLIGSAAGVGARSGDHDPQAFTYVTGTVSRDLGSMECHGRGSVRAGDVVTFGACGFDAYAASDPRLNGQGWVGNRNFWYGDLSDTGSTVERLHRVSASTRHIFNDEGSWTSMSYGGFLRTSENEPDREDDVQVFAGGGAYDGWTAFVVLEAPVVEGGTERQVFEGIIFEGSPPAFVTTEEMPDPFRPG